MSSALCLVAATFFHNIPRLCRLEQTWHPNRCLTKRGCRWHRITRQSARRTGGAMAPTSVGSARCCSPTATTTGRTSSSNCFRTRKTRSVGAVTRPGRARSRSRWPRPGCYSPTSAGRSMRPTCAAYAASPKARRTSFRLAGSASASSRSTRSPTARRFTRATRISPSKTTCSRNGLTTQNVGQAKRRSSCP
ncbi:hypothetical protein D9M68_790350 [compost metagenome]